MRYCTRTIAPTFISLVTTPARPNATVRCTASSEVVCTAATRPKSTSLLSLIVGDNQCNISVRVCKVLEW